MDRERLTARRDELTGELEKIKAALFRVQGQVAMLNEMLSMEDPKEGEPGEES